MKVIVTRSRLNEEQKRDLNVQHEEDFEWQITPGKEYLVISIGNILNSAFYGNAVLFSVEDDFGRLLDVPSCLFKVSCARPSKYWKASIRDSYFILQPQEFEEDSSLSEKILDREPEALKVFEGLKAKLSTEA